MTTPNDSSVSPAFALLHEVLRDRVLMLDGAMGTMIQRHQLTEADFRGERFNDQPKDQRGNSDLLNLTRPDVIGSIHREYLAAGADIVETNTFTSTAIAQADYGLEAFVYEMNVEGARLAKAAALEWTAKTPDRPRFAAGSLGPMNRTLSISPDVNDPSFRGMTFDQARAAYEEQVRGLLDGGVDLLLLETIFDTLNAKAAIVAIETVFEERGIRLPLMISVTITDRSGRTLSGQTLDAFYTSIRHARPFTVGLNCALGARDMRPYLAELAQMAECYVSVYPNAGLPNAFGGYDELPEETGGLLRDFVESGFTNIVGGCCGTTPDHIAAVRKAIEGLPPRPLPADSWLRGRNSQLPNSATPKPRTLLPVLRPRDADHPARQQFPDDRRAHQRHRLRQVRPADQEQQLRRSGAGRGGAGPGRRQPDRRQHGRRHARLRAGHDHLPQLHRDRARDRPGAGGDRQLEMVGDRSRAQMRAGQERRQLDQPEGRGGRLPAQGQAGPALRRRRGGDGVRRGGAGRHHSSARSRSASAPTSC